MTAYQLCVASQKGGAGKTTVAANLAGAFAALGLKVLAVDLDSQAQLADALGAGHLLERDERGTVVSPTVADFILPGPRDRQLSLADAVIETPYENLFVLPGGNALEERRRAMESSPSEGLAVFADLFETSALAEQGLNFDYIVYDTAPKLDVLLESALYAAHGVLGVMAPELQQVEPITRFAGKVRQVQRRRSELIFLGVVMNRVNAKWRASSDIPAEIVELGIPVFENQIRQYAAISNAFGTGPVVFAEPAGVAAEAVFNVAAEVAERIGGHK